MQTPASDLVTTQTLLERKQSGEKIAMLTAYDATFGRLLDAAGVDAILVGDSLGMVIQGHDNTLPVTLAEMVYHCRAVARGVRRAHLVADMPFMTYQQGTSQALDSAAALLQRGGAHAVKLEGGERVCPQVDALVTAGIPTMGHIGLTPQSVHQMGGFRVQGKKHNAAERLRNDATALQQAGCYALVLEGIPAPLARDITRSLAIPTIGIGAGGGCDGQVLVSYDMLGMTPEFKPKFVRWYAQLHQVIADGVRRFTEDVRSGDFPSAAESFDAPSDAAEPATTAASSQTEGSQRGSSRSA